MCSYVGRKFVIKILVSCIRSLITLVDKPECFHLDCLPYLTITNYITVSSLSISFTLDYFPYIIDQLMVIHNIIYIYNINDIVLQCNVINFNPFLTIGLGQPDHLD